ncbi:hypothetical protein [Methanobrevibacter wolinii]|uniref:hypothetical protein n=1 Tax=Methanobrevibacter wolinii TaxID=190977 RepID=UPI0005B265E4|nr:hypothetical protein [Methanobrevibacter wolinii]
MYNNPNFNKSNCRHNNENRENMNFNDDFLFKEHGRRNCRHNNNIESKEHGRRNCRYQKDFNNSFDENDKKFRCHRQFNNCNRMNFNELSDDDFENYCHRRQRCLKN